MAGNSKFRLCGECQKVASNKEFKGCERINGLGTWLIESFNNPCSKCGARVYLEFLTIAWYPASEKSSFFVTKV
ncbi:MAG: hypothetical protein AB1403_02470 [Candidatus Riflebacteria bacterium]